MTDSRPIEAGRANSAPGRLFCRKVEPEKSRRDFLAPEKRAWSEVCSPTRRRQIADSGRKTGTPIRRPSVKISGVFSTLGSARISRRGATVLRNLNPALRAYFSLTEVDVQDVEYQHQPGKAWLARIYQPKGTNHQDPLSIQERDSRWATTLSRNTRHRHDSN